MSNIQKVAAELQVLKAPKKKKPRDVKDGRCEGGTGSYAVRAAPGALGGLLHVGVQADHVIGSGTGVAQDDLPPLLAHLAVVLVVRLIAVAVLCFC